MKKNIIQLLVLIVVISCSSKSYKVERILEHGVEVVINGCKPYMIKGKPNKLILEQEFTIDTEDDEIAKTGLTDINSFDCDDAGNIYFLNIKNPDNMILKFSNSGEFIKAFGKQGQGPEEFQNPSRIFIHQNKIYITDQTTKKLIIITTEGNLLCETRIDPKIREVIPLTQNKYLIYNWYMDSYADFSIQESLGIYNMKFEKLLELYNIKTPNMLKTHEYKVGEYYFTFFVTDERIYIGTRKKDYEILVYDTDGKLIRKIRKDFTKVKYSKESKKVLIESMPPGSPVVKWFVFPKFFKAYSSLFCSKNGYLFVQTNEKGEKSGDYWYDIFNPEGIFIDRVSLNIYCKLSMMTNDCLYVIRSKESGYKELVIYKIKWKNKLL